MSGGTWGFASAKIRGGGIPFSQVQEFMQWLGVLENAADRAQCGDDCSACFRAKAPGFIFCMFDAVLDGMDTKLTDPVEAWDAQKGCERCESWKKERP